MKEVGNSEFLTVDHFIELMCKGDGAFQKKRMMTLFTDVEPPPPPVGKNQKKRIMSPAKPVEKAPET